jgi:hypothetical protein
MSSPSHLSRIITYLRIHLNFYRLHLIALCAPVHCLSEYTLR